MSALLDLIDASTFGVPHFRLFLELYYNVDTIVYR